MTRSTHTSLRIALPALVCMSWSAWPTPAIAQWANQMVAMAQTSTLADTQHVHPATDSTSAGSAAWRAALLGTQINVIGQDLLPFRSPYASTNSLRANGDARVSDAYGVYGGVQVGAHLQGYLDVEMVRGRGISGVVGLGDPTNGDVLRQGTVDLGYGPYVARAFLRYTVGVGHAGADTIDRGVDQMPGAVPRERFEISAGKFAASDIFDVNRYANSTRQQFMNWGLFNNTAWDFAADTRGYSNGIVLAWIEPMWALRVGSFQMPRFANGNVFDSDLRRARGDQAELTVTAPVTGTVARVLGYINHARMGSYAEALAIAQEKDTTPNIVADDKPGRSKYGWGVNLEQPLADSGETGAFARIGWNDGKNESFVFAEVDREMSLGVQISGAHWGRRDDRLGIAGLESGLSTLHREYLGAGGYGFLLGDGKLSYAPEEIAELYYRTQLGPYLQIGPDVQEIRNPGYNHVRGPASVLSFRVNLRY